MAVGISSRIVPQSMATPRGETKKMSAVDKNCPTAGWIAALRRRFPCEREIDRILTRKLERRAGPPYAPVSLETLFAGTQALLRSKLAGDFTITEARWLAGGASKLQMAFTLDWDHENGAADGTIRINLGDEPAGGI
jgi:hypothetical protein